jgi:hypothetical protein
MAFDDFFQQDEFLIDPEDFKQSDGIENWDTGNQPDIFASGNEPDIFSTKNVVV